MTTSKLFHPFFATAIAVSICLNSTAAEFPRVGDTLPDVTAIDENGKPFPLREKLKGKRTVLVFGCLT